jgi:hypothetical protein
MADARLTKTLVAAVVVLSLVVCYQVARFRNQNEIARVQAQVGRLERERDSIQAIVAVNAELQKRLRETRDNKEAEIGMLRDHVDLLERSRRESAISVRRLRKSSDLQARLEATFPEMAHSNWGITTIPFEPDDTLGLEYFLIPAWFTETFLIDHENAASWREQKNNLLAVDSLRVKVAALQDSVATLHARNVLALQTGYDNASAECRDLSTRYIAELSRTRFSIGSTVGLCVGAAGAAALIATLANR